jgi:hypothetical protein
VVQIIHRLRINLDKTVTVRISRNQDTNVRISVNNILVEGVDRFIYLGSEINSEWKIDGDVNRKI